MRKFPSGIGWFKHVVEFRKQSGASVWLRQTTIQIERHDFSLLTILVAPCRDDYFHAWLHFAQGARKRKPIHERHDDVRHHQADFLAVSREKRQSLDPVFGEVDR